MFHVNRPFSPNSPWKWRFFQKISRVNGNTERGLFLYEDQNHNFYTREQKPKLLHKGVLAEIEGLGFPGSSPKLWFLCFWAQNCGSKGGPLFWDPEKQFLSRSLLLKLIRFDWMSFSWKIGHRSWSQKLSPPCRCTTCSMLSAFSFNSPGIKLFSKKAHVGTFKEGTAFLGSDLGLKECCKWILALSKLNGKCWVPEVLISAWYPLCQSKTTCAHDVPS